VGSFDGESWLWSWANPFLRIPTQKTTVSRALRDSAEKLGVPALAVPMIAARDERLPYMMGNFVVAHGFAEAYYLANRSQVYAIAAGQLEADRLGPIDEVRRALASCSVGDLSCDLRRAIPFAAQRLGLDLAREERALVLRSRDPRDELRISLTRDGLALRKLATCFVPARMSLGAVLDHLQQDEALRQLGFDRLGDSALEAEGRGFSIRITRTDRLREVMREASLLRRGADRAKRCTTAFVIETALSAGYDGAAYGSFEPVSGLAAGLWAPVSIEALTGVHLHPVIASEALAACERLDALDGAVVYDFVLQALYSDG
jgi:hypothetical protein